VEHKVAPLRRQRSTHVDQDVTFLALVERDDGSFTWREGLGARTPAGQRRGRFVSALPGRIAGLFKTQRLPVNQVGRYLAEVDLQLTPNPGLRELQQGQFVTLPDTASPSAQGRILLFIHGTFSNSEMYIDQLKVTSEGRTFLKDAEAHYDQILAFEHPTLSVSPVLNAVDLARRFAQTSASIDVIAHSRGGLVTRWWLEGFGGSAVARRVVLAGSPLDGTSLAAPHRLRSALDFVTSIGNMFKTMATASSIYLPFMTVGIGLARVFTAVTSVASKTPLADAAISLVPGLCCQSRVDNNYEMQRLRRVATKMPDYYFIRSNFEPDPVGWRFWRRFVRWKGEIVDLGADLIFDQPNDLVVDTSSMDSLAAGVPPPDSSHVLDFKTTETVHHCNYFQQKQTAEMLQDTLLK
jgi:pimeloyl-ACP methyl ester carboxylesterase